LSVFFFEIGYWDSAERPSELSFKRFTEVLGMGYEEHTELEDEDV